MVSSLKIYSILNSEEFSSARHKVFELLVSREQCDVHSNVEVVSIFLPVSNPLFLCLGTNCYYTATNYTRQLDLRDRNVRRNTSCLIPLIKL